MSYQGIRDVYFTQEKAMLMGAGYTILECFADPMRDVSGNLFETFWKKSLHMLCALLKKIAEESWDHTDDTHLKIKVLKSACVIGGLEPTAQSVSKTGKYIQGVSPFVEQKHRVTGTDSFGRDKKLETVLCC